MQAERVAVVGAGAVGCYFGGMLARAGVPVTLIGRAFHVEAVQRDGLFLERSDFQGYVRSDADVHIEAVRKAAIVLLCVKTVDTESAAVALAPHVGDGAILVSLQNGVDNVERIRRATGIDAVPAVVYVAVATAAGVFLPDAEHLTTAALKLGQAMAEATSSTAQDLARGKPTEIDSLNGYVARRGAELGVPAPVNSTLHALVKLLESTMIR